MAFCSNCGVELGIDSKFCSKCGNFNESSYDEKHYEKTTNRKYEYSGNIKKCPACGAEVLSFNAMCSSCGHEFNSHKIESHFKEFKDKINYFDELIADSNESCSTGWKTWKKETKILWVILNILTSCIPLIVYLIFPLIRTLVMPKNDASLNLSEQAKASFIKNYVFPNEREATYEAILFTKSNLAFLSNEKLNNKTLYWINLWIIKAEQLKEKADIILKDDSIIDNVFADISLYKKNSQRIIVKRAIIGAIIILGYSTLVIVNGSVWNLASKIIFHREILARDDSQWLDTGLSCNLPNIEGKEVIVHTNSGTELWIDVEDVSYKQFEKYIEECKNWGYSMDAVKTTHTYKAYNDGNDLLELSHYSDDLDIRLTLVDEIIDEGFTWPAGELGLKIPRLEDVTGIVKINNDDCLNFELIALSQSDFDSYIEECKVKGFNIDAEIDNSSYVAYDSEGYKLDISYNDIKTLKIIVEAPLEMSEYDWPESKIVESLPKPNSSIGYISINEDDTFSIYVGRTSVDEFNEYVDECLNEGYDADYSRYDKSFYAENDNGDRLHIEYQGYNIMYINIYNWN